MAAQPHDRRLYPPSDNGHQFSPFAPPQAVANRVRHPPIMPHSTGSAFRPHGAHAVPVDQPFMPRGHIPSTSQHYPQQQPVVPSRSVSKHIVHPHQQQQQINFQNVPLRHPFNEHPQISTDLHPRGIQGGVVPPVAPHHIPRDLQADKNGDPESMHQELRMLHALHYQDKVVRQQHGMKSSEVVLRQQMMHTFKGVENPHTSLGHEIQREQHPLMQHESLFKGQVTQKVQQASQPHPPQERLLRQYEELAHPRRRSLVGCPPPNVNLTEPASFIPEVHSRLTSPAQQNIHQVVHGNFAQKTKRYPPNFTHVSQEYSDIARVRQTSTPPQQPQVIMQSHKLVQHSKPIEHAYLGEVQNPATYMHRRAIAASPTVGDNITMVKPHSQQHPYYICGQRTPVRADHLPAQQVSCQSLPSQVKQRFSHNAVHAAEKQTHSHSLHPAEINYHQVRERQRESEPRYLPHGRAYCEPRSSTSPQRGISIKQEQMLIKEKLELSLQQASGGLVKKEAKTYEIPKSMENTPDQAITSSGIESMPRIVEVRSLANQETRTVQMAMAQGQPKNSYLIPEQVDVIPNDIKPTKPKSLMIKAHQELYEAPMSAHRVPSRCSMDSENGRKDSWDSGIESPTLPDVNKENGVYVKRGTSLQYETLSVNSLQQHQNLKAQEYRGLEKISHASGLDLCSKMPPAAAMDFMRTNSLVESSNITPKENKSNYRGTPGNPYMSGTLSTRFDEKTVAPRNIEVMPKKRSWPLDDCPVQPKVVSREEEAIDYSFPEVKSTAKALNEVPGSSDTAQEQTASEEFPLDLTVKKEKANANVCTKEEKVCKKEDKMGTLSEERTPSDSQLQGYFGTIMMRALKRLWATTRFKLDVDGANIAKPECAESSDEDSGKYFKPSSVTTLDDIPGSDKVEDTLHKIATDHKNNREPGESLENVICELMQQSSGAFKHGSDIFQHFDTLIKRELLLEMENQALNDNEASTSTEVKTSDLSGEACTDQQKVASVEDQSSEAIALHSDSPSFPVDDQDMDESQNLVIVESSMSPKVSPDSQEMRHIVEDDSTNLNENTSHGELEGTTAVDSSISSERLGENVYEKAARLAVEKAARVAASRAAKEASEYAARAATERSARATKVLSSPHEDDLKLGESTLLEIIDVESGLSPQPSTSLLDKQSKPCTTIEEQTRTLAESPPSSFKRLYKQQEERITSISLSNASGGNDLRCSDRKGGNLCKFNELDVNLNEIQRQVGIERRSSAPIDLTENRAHDLNLSHRALQIPLQRRFSEDDLGEAKLGRENRSPSAEVPQQPGKSHPKITSTVWQAQGVHANKVKLMKVPSSTHQVQPPPLQTVQDKIDMQGQFQRSPIVILPKIMCVPGQSYPSPPVSVMPSSAQRNVVIIQQNQTQQQPNPVSVLNTSTVMQTPPSRTVQIPVYNITVGGSTSTSPTTNTSPQQSGPLSPYPPENEVGPFQIIRKSPLEPSSAKKPSVSSYFIIYKDVSLPGVVRSGVPFVPPKMLQDGMFPSKTFEIFCHALQESNIMQRYMTVLERAALLPDLRHNKISSCKLVSLEEFHERYDNIKLLMQKEDSDEVK